jgi:hypothetical protein
MRHRLLLAASETPPSAEAEQRFGGRCQLPLPNKAVNLGPA